MILFVILFKIFSLFLIILNNLFIWFDDLFIFFLILAAEPENSRETRISNIKITITQ